VTWEVELVGEVPFAEFCQAKGFGKRGEWHLEKTEGIDETKAIVFDFQQFTPVPELLDQTVVAIVLMNDKVAIVPLEIVSEYIDLSCVIECQGIQPFQKISDAMLAQEPNGTIVVFGFGHDEIGDVLFLGLHGFNIKKHVQGGQVVVVLRGGFRLCGSSFPLSFLLVLRLGGCLNKTSMSFTVHVLVAGGTIYIPALMLFNLV